MKKSKFTKSQIVAIMAQQEQVLSTKKSDFIFTTDFNDRALEKH